MISSAGRFFWDGTESYTLYHNPDPLPGEPAPVLRANIAFRALRVPAGRHTATFRYRPRSLLAGLWISALSALILLPLSLVLPRRGGGSLPATIPPPAGAGRRRRLMVAAAILLVLLVSLVLRWPFWWAALRGLALPPA